MCENGILSAGVVRVHFVRSEGGWSRVAFSVSAGCLLYKGPDGEPANRPTPLSYILPWAGYTPPFSTPSHLHIVHPPTRKLPAEENRRNLLVVVNFVKYYAPLAPTWDTGLNVHTLAPKWSKYVCTCTWVV